MGKASKFFRGIFGLKKPSDSDRKTTPPSSSSSFSREKRRWSFVRSCKNDSHRNDAVESDGAEQNAVAVAAATAVAAEAAVAAAKAAVEVVRLTSAGERRRAGTREEEWAAVRIQSAFRGCLARRALRALKGLVKLQALVRGHIERKRTAEWLHRMQAMIQAQARAIVGRKDSHLTNPGPATPEKIEHVIRSRSRKHEPSSLLRRNSSKSNGRTVSDEAQSYGTQFYEKSGSLRSSSVRNDAVVDDKSDRIIEIVKIDPWHHPWSAVPKRRNLFHSDERTGHVFASFDDDNAYADADVEEASFCTANDSPRFCSAGSSRRSPFTPSRSDGSASFLSGFSDCPSYMAYTESSKAKVRSASAPRQRPNYERSGSTKRAANRVGALHASFVSKAYPGSGRLDKLGMPVGYRYY